MPTTTLGRRPAAIVAALVTALALALSMTVSVAGSANAATRHRKVHHALRIARHQKGDPYRYGSDGPNRFDCSGLTYFAFHKRSGFRHFPRTASAQSHFTRHIKRSHMRAGDLIFFSGHGGVYHVGIFGGWYHGHRMVLHAPHPGERVHTQPLWTSHWFAGTMRHR
ncbi:MAG: C40 family peptidase [Marmoricola sp.]